MGKMLNRFHGYYGGGRVKVVEYGSEYSGKLSRWVKVGGG
jgi:hypothetical protein